MKAKDLKKGDLIKIYDCDTLMSFSILMSGRETQIGMVLKNESAHKNSGFERFLSFFVDGKVLNRFTIKGDEDQLGTLPFKKIS